jgi:hypothetical protein
MKALQIFYFAVILTSCSHKLQGAKNTNSAISLIERQHKQKQGVKKSSSFAGYDKRIFEIRQKAAILYNISTDTSLIEEFIVIDWMNYEGGDFNGEMIVNNTAKYFYKASYKNDEPVFKSEYPVSSENIIFTYLKDGKFEELEKVAKERGKTLSGSNFIYIGMFKKGMDSIYVKVIPGFMVN